MKFNLLENSSIFETNDVLGVFDSNTKKCLYSYKINENKNENELFIVNDANYDNINGEGFKEQLYFILYRIVNGINLIEPIYVSSYKLNIDNVITQGTGKITPRSPLESKTEKGQYENIIFKYVPKKK